MESGHHAEDEPMQPVTYDTDADVLYVRLNDGQSTRQSRLGDLRIIDFDQDGTILGVEFVDASGGADLRDLPFAQRVEQLIHDSGLPIRLFA